MKKLSFQINTDKSTDALIIKLNDFFINNDSFNNWTIKEYFTGDFLRVDCEKFDIDQFNQILKTTKNATVYYGSPDGNIKMSLTKRIDQGVPPFMVEIIFPESELTPSKIDYLWQHLEEFYWELGGEGVLYAKVGNMKDFQTYGKQNNFPKAVFSGGERYAWRLLVHQDHYLDYYTKETYLAAPYIKIEERENNNLYIQTYNELFKYLEEPNISHIIHLLTFLAPHKKSIEETKAHRVKVHAKKNST